MTAPRPLGSRLAALARAERPGLLLLCAFCALYLLLPFDLVPDFLPAAGRLDDAAVAAAAFLALRRRLDGAASPRLSAWWLSTALITLAVTNYVALTASPPAAFYDALYKVGAPWDRLGPDPEITSYMKEQVLPDLPAGARALDLGCGTGGYVIFMASHGLQAVGVDFSQVALDKAKAAAAEAGLEGRASFVYGDLTKDSLPGVAGPFSLLLDVSTFDDLGPGGRRNLAALAAGLSKPGAVFLACEHVKKPPFGLPAISMLLHKGVSQLRPGEIEELFGPAFDVAPPHSLRPDNPCFVLRRKAG